MIAIDRPLRLGEVLAETVRLYGERLWAALGLGAMVAAAFVVAGATGNALAAIAVLTGTFAVGAATAARLAVGDGFAEAWGQALVRLPVLLVLTLAVWVPFTLGITLGIRAPWLLLFVAAWLALVGFSIPVAMLEGSEAPPGWLGLLGYSIRRSYALARAQYLHAFGVVAALVVVYVLLGNLLAQLLVGFAESGGFAAFVLAQLVLAPFFFLGLAVLYFDQKARALSSPRSQ